MSTTQHRSSPLLRPALDHGAAMRLAATEYGRMVDVLADLQPDDWTRPTACSAWDVRQMGCHLVGMARMAASPLEARRQQKKAAAIATATGVDALTALTGLQVSERSGWAPADVVAGARRVAPRAARGRRWTPGFIRNRAMAVAQDVGGHQEHWSLGFLIDVILTRDPWMHRMDLAAATGRPPLLSADHDAVIVADVVAEWAGRHDAAYELELTGLAGGSWRRGSGGERIALDAVDFCRAVSGRGSAVGLLTVQVPF